MPPKKQPTGKVTTKEKQKIVEDKTFGMKNKNKSAKVQKYIHAVEKQVDQQTAPKKTRVPEAPKKSKAELEAEKKNELNQLFRITQAKVPVGVDPKSIVCEFFKQGQCTKGLKCKFSHDLATARKAEKIDLYTDRREGSDDTMDNWTQDKLEEVVQSKHETSNKNHPTEIICRYFIDAVENKKYGWFWECPNGVDKCQYRHALPPGFVLNKKKKLEEEEEQIEKKTVEEEIEEARQTLETHTPVTYEKFLEWKKKKEFEKEEQKRKEMEERQREIKAGRKEMSGREMFTYNPDLFVDDEEAFGEEAYEEEEEEVVAVVTATATSLSRIPVVHEHRENGDDDHEHHEDEEQDLHGDEEENTEGESREHQATILSNVDQSLFDVGAEDFGDEDDE